MANMLTAAASGLVAILIGTHAFGQTQPFTAPTPGTVIYTVNGRVEIDSIDGMILRTVNAKLAPGQWLAGCYDPAVQSTFDRNAIAALWPLSPGKTITFEQQRNEKRWSLTFKVGEPGKTTVRAGTFETWPIDVETTALTHTFKGIVHCSYAPEIGFSVKRTQETIEGDGPKGRFEAVRIEKHDRSKIAEFRAPEPGTTFRTTDGSYRIDGADGANLIRKTENRSTSAVWIGGFRPFNLYDVTIASYMAEANKLWPLEVGKSVSISSTRPGDFNNPSSTWNHTLSVERTEVITVPAGTFSTFVVKWHERGLGQNGYEGVYTYWWSPALGFAIKRDMRVLRGIANLTNYELVSVTAPPPLTKAAATKP